MTIEFKVGDQVICLRYARPPSRGIVREVCSDGDLYVDWGSIVSYINPSEVQPVDAVTLLGEIKGSA